MIQGIFFVNSKTESEGGLRVVLSVKPQLYIKNFSRDLEVNDKEKKPRITPGLESSPSHPA
jgi:hypothetical protein